MSASICVPSGVVRNAFCQKFPNLKLRKIYEKTKKSKDLQYIDGKNEQLEKDKESLSRLEMALAVKEKRNPFQSDTSEDFENKLKQMTLVEMQSMAVACGVFPSGNKTTLKNKLINSEDSLITRSRHRENLEQCLFHLNNFEKQKSENDFDKAAEDLRLATRHLGMIVGKVDVEEILGSIFSDFCIGK